MDLFDSKRQERLEAATASKEASLKFLIDAGILDKMETGLHILDNGIQK